MRIKPARKKTKKRKKPAKKAAKVRPLSELGAIVRVQGGGGYFLHSS